MLIYMRKIVMGAMIVGSILGGYAPLLWSNGSVFSMAGIFCSFVGGILGIWLGYRVSRAFG